MESIDFNKNNKDVKESLEIPENVKKKVIKILNSDGFSM